jgi:hypothetical protein
VKFLQKTQLKKAIIWLKNGLIAYSLLTLFAHSAQPMAVLAAETTESAQNTPMVGSAPDLEAPVVPEKVLTTQEVLLEVCKERGYGEDCAKHLLGMLWKESNNIGKAIGDRGKARGYFQIHYKMHKISLECAEDLRCSADWTISYLERNSYPKYVNYAVQCHNGCNIDNGYAASALRHGRRLWNQPLPLNTTTEKLALQ